MPIASLDVPTGVELGSKREMVKAMYQALHDAWPFPDDVRIFLREWADESVSQNGLLGSEPPRPVFTIHAPQGGDLDVKRTMPRKINAAVAAAYPVPDFMVFIVAYPLELAAHQGRPLADDPHRVQDQHQAY